MKFSNDRQTLAMAANNLSAVAVLDLSDDHAQRYCEQHDAIPGLADVFRSVIAEARLQALLEECRPKLSGRLTHHEFISLLDCFPGKLFDPKSVEDMAGAVVDDKPQNAPLAQKVASFSTAERFTLADLLEQAWYRSAAEGKSMTAICGELGVSFATPTPTAG